MEEMAAEGQPGVRGVASPRPRTLLLAELAKQVQFELGDQYVNGTYGDDDDHLFNGILTQMAKDTEVIISDSKETTMLGKLKAVRSLIPKAIRNNPKLRILMSIDDFDKYDDELTEREAKNASETDVNAQRYKGIKIETLAAWPDGLIVATLCSPGCRRQPVRGREPAGRRGCYPDRQDSERE